MRNTEFKTLRPFWRDFLKKIPGLRLGFVWWTSVWADLRLLLLTLVGYIPSHCFRNCIYRMSGLKLENSSSIHWRARFFCPEGVEIGSNCIIGNDAFFDGRDRIVLGQNVNIAAEVRIYTREHDIDDPYFSETGGAVKIEDYVYVGTRVTILPGVTLGEGCVVASGAVVAKDVPPYVLVGGVPAKFIRGRSRDLRYRLQYAKRFQ